jgi:hypothetical protein
MRVKRSVQASILLALVFSISVSAQKRPGVGYIPPPVASVFHCDAPPQALAARGCPSTTPFNPAIAWSGSSGDDQGYVGRYLGGNRGCLGAWICGIGNENECLRASEELRAKFALGELGDMALYDGEPTRVECHDYGMSRPELGRIGSGGSDLPESPDTPPGCCKKAFPCLVDEIGRRTGEMWSKPVSTSIGGRKGCFFVQKERKDEQEPVCWLLRVAGSNATVTSTECRVINGTPPGQPACWLVRTTASKVTTLEPLVCP